MTDNFLRATSKENYLGIPFSNDQNHCQNCSENVKKANKLIAIIIYFFKNKSEKVILYFIIIWFDAILSNAYSLGPKGI